MNFLPFLKTAEQAALEAGRMLRENMDAERRVEFKGDVNIVTDFDKKAQGMIVERIKSEYPDHDFLGEENLDEDEGGGFLWLIDPIDGTTNFLHRFPMFCVSVALKYRDEIVVGAVYDPMREEMFTASKGGRACLNRKKISVSHVKELGQAMLSTGFPYDIRETRINNIDHFINFITRAQAIRRGGSAALDLCYVACGRFDGFWELKLSPWDHAAASLILMEAGGRMSDFRNGPFHVFLKQTLGSNGLIHEQMVEVLKRGVFPDPERIPSRSTHV